MEKKRNLWIVPTDKPSRLCLSNTCILSVIEEANYNLSDIKSVNIYITNDEEIKEGDWYLYKETFLDGTVKTEDQFKNSSWGISKATKGDMPYIERAEKGRNTKNGLRGIFKIILTTDLDLIKDGIQAIEDEFLEWFVKNPSCESVETIYNKDVFPYGVETSKGYGWYTIIIPKEEPCTCTDECLGYLTKTCKRIKEEPKMIECYFIPSNNTSSETICGNCGKEKFLHTIGSGIKVSKSVIITQEEPKQETLEEVAERILFENTNNIEIHYRGGKENVIKAMIEITKYQAKEMYSEEEVKEIVKLIMIQANEAEFGSLEKFIDKKFEQFKKK